MTDPAAAANRAPGKTIHCVLPDDGTDKRLLLALRAELGVIRATSQSCRGVGALAGAETKRGKVPTSTAVKLIQVFVDEDQADAVFDFIFDRARLKEPGRGIMWESPLIASTSFALPDVPDEPDR